MRITTLIEHSAELIRIIYNSPQPADKILSEYFRSKKQYGSKERKFAVNTIYFVLRNYLLFGKIAEECKSVTNKEFSKEVWNILIGLILSDNFTVISESYFPSELISKVESEENTNSILQKIFENDYPRVSQFIQGYFLELETKISEMKSLDLSKEEIELLNVRFSLPIFLFSSIISGFSDLDELKHFLRNSTEQAPITFRLNTVKSSSDEILEEMKSIDPNIIKSDIIPNCLHTYNRIQLNELTLYKNGLIEVQDEGSQLISLVLNPCEKEIILDACAGAGGKSLHIALLQNNNGLVVSNDIEFQRLKEIPKRALRAGITTILSYLSQNKKDNFREILKLTKEHLFHKVLIDAPCSGSGTIRRDPLKKYRINPKLIEKINKNQANILQEYSRYVRPGGILLYSTCSILPDENEKIVEDFLNKNPNFAPVSILEGVKHEINKNYIRINKYRINIDFRNSKSDGFFMAKMQRLD